MALRKIADIPPSDPLVPERGKKEACRKTGLIAQGGVKKSGRLARAAYLAMRLQRTWSSTNMH